MKSFAPILLSVFTASLLAGCDSPSKVDEIGVDRHLNDVSKTITMSGLVVDAYIKDAVVYVDENNNGVKDDNEPEAITDYDGYFGYNPITKINYCASGPAIYCLEINPDSEHNLVRSIGGTDTITGQPFEGQMLMKLPEGSTSESIRGVAISPITSVAAFMDDTKKQALLATLNLPTDADLNKVDPLNFEQAGETAENQQQRLQVLTKIQNTVQAISSGLSGGDKDVLPKINEIAFESMAEKITLVTDELKREQNLQTEQKDNSIDSLLDATIEKVIEKAETAELTEAVKETAQKLSKSNDETGSDLVARNALLENIVTLDQTTETVFETQATDSETAKALLFRTELVGEQVNRDPLTQDTAGAAQALATSEVLSQALEEAAQQTSEDSETVKKVDFDLLSSVAATEKVTTVAVIENFVEKAQVEVTDKAENLAPIVMPQNWLLTENETGEIRLSAVDPERQTLTFAVKVLPEHGELTLNGNQATYQPEAGYHGSDQFTYSVSDELTEMEGVVDIYINGAPSLVARQHNAVAGKVFSSSTVASDPENDPVSYLLVSEPKSGVVVLDEATGLYQYLANVDSEGSDQFQLVAFDGVSYSETINIDLTISPNPKASNTAPVVNKQAIEVVAGETLIQQLVATDVDGDDLIFQMVTFPAEGQTSLSANGVLSFSISANTVDKVLPFEITVTDGIETVTQELSIDLFARTQANTAPTASDQKFSLTETFTGQVFGADADQDALTYQLITTAAHGVLDFVADGRFTYRPNVAFSGEDSFTYLVTDGIDSATATVSFEVIKGNAAPVAQSIQDALVIEEFEPLSGSISAVDADQDPLTFQVLSAPISGDLDFDNTSGDFTYTPDGQFVGDVIFTFVANDGIFDSNVGQVIISIVAPNQPPVLGLDKFETIEDVSISFTQAKLMENDGDPEGDPLVFVGFDQPNNGNLNLVDGEFTYSPHPNYYGEDTFAYRLQDPEGLETEAFVTLVITSINDVPMAVNDVFSVDEDNVLRTDMDTILLNDQTVVDGDMEVSVVSLTEHGTVVIEDGLVTYTPKEHFNGSDQFTYSLLDTFDNETSLGTVQITVNPVDDVPIIVNDELFAVEGQTVQTTDVLANDIEYDALYDPLQALRVIEPPSDSEQGGVVVYNNDGTFSYTAPLEYYGSDIIKYKVTDGITNIDGEILITVSPVNNPPTITSPDTISVNEKIDPSTIIYTATATDPEDGVLTYRLLGTDSGLFTFSSDAELRFINSPNFEVKDEYIVEIEVTDGELLTDVQTLTINIIDQNDTGSVTLDRTLPEQHQLIIATVVDEDTISQPISYQWLANSLSINGATSDRYTPVQEDVGKAISVEIQYTDDFGEFESFTSAATAPVLEVNDPPVITSAVSASVNENVAVSTLLYTATATDPENAALTYRIKGTDSALLTMQSNGELRFVNSPNFESQNTYQVEVEALDPEGGITEISLTLTIIDQNDIGSVSLDNLAPAQGQNVVATVFDEDSISNTISYQWLRDGVSITGANQSLYQATQDDVGRELSVSIQYTDDFGQIESFVSEVTANVAEVNDAPLAVNDSLTTDEDTAITISFASLLLNDSDQDGDAISMVTSVTGIDNGSVVQQDENWVFTPDQDYHGSTAGFTYQIQDVFGETANAQVEITVTPVNDDPVPTADVVTVLEDTSVTAFNLLANDTDVDGDSLSVSFPSLSTAGGSLVNHSDGTFSYTPVVDFSGVDSFDYVVTDGAVNVTQSVTINVTEVNDAPVVTSAGTLSINENIAAATPIYNITASDIENDALTYSLNGTDGADFTVSATGEVSINASPDFEVKPSYDLVLQVTDINTGLGTLPLTVTVVNQNDLGSVTIDNMAPTETDTLMATVYDQDSISGIISYQWNRNSVAIAGATSDSYYLVHDDANQQISVSVSYTDDSGYSESFDSAQTSSVININQTPVVSGLTGTMTEDETSLVGNFTITDGDGSAEELFVVKNSIPQTYGTFSLTDAGAWTYQLDTLATDILALSPGQTIDETISIQAFDGTTENLVITITGVNDAPIATDDTLTTDEDVPVTTQGLMLNDSDYEGSTLEIISPPTTTSQGGSLVYNGDGTFDYTPALNFNGTDSFDYILSDGNLTDTATVTITVNSVNDTPQFDSIEIIGVIEDDLYTYNILASDADLQAVAITADTLPAWLSFTDNGDGTATLTGTPVFSDLGDYAIGLHVTDGSSTADQNFTLTVADKNDPPTNIVLSNNQFDEGLGTAWSATLSAVDVDIGDTYNYSISAPAAGYHNELFSIVNGDELQLSEVGNYEVQSTYRIELTVTDLGGLSFTDTYEVYVDDVPEAATDITLLDDTIEENTGLSWTTTLAAVDEDAGETYSFVLDNTIEAGLNNDVFNISGSTLSFTEAGNFEQKITYRVGVTVTDSGGESFSKALTVSMEDVNEAPTDIVLSDADFNEGNGTAWSALITSTDEDAGDTHSYTFDPAGGSWDNAMFSISGNVLTTSESGDFENKSFYAINVISQDASGLTYSKSFNINVLDVDEPPVINSGTTASINENVAATTVFYTVDATDPEGSALTYSVSDLTNFAVAANGDISINASPDFEAQNSYSFTLTVEDNNSKTAVTTITLSVVDQDDLGTASIDDTTPQQGDVLTASITDQDGTSAPFTYQWKRNGTNIAGATSVTYATLQDDVGTNLSVDVSYTDSFGTPTVSSAPTGIVIDQAFAPVFSSSPVVSADEDSLYGYAVAATDADNEALSFSIANKPAWASFTDNGDGTAILSGTPLGTDLGTYTDITITVDDGNSTPVQQVFDLTVNNVNDAPTFINFGNIPASIIEGETALGTVEAQDEDTGTTLTFSISGGADAALFNINASTGVLAFNTAPDYEAPADAGADNSYEVEVQVSDGALTASHTFTIAINDKPDVILTLADATADEGTSIVGIDGTLSIAPTADMVFLLSTGSTMTFTTGTTTASSPYVVPGDDVYIDSMTDTVTATLSTGGSEFENIDVTDTADVTINDTSDTVTLDLSATASITEADTSIDYTATLTHAADGNVTVELDSGLINITILDGQTTATVTHTIAADEDVYIETDSRSATITNATGGNFEDLQTGVATASTTVTDTTTVNNVVLSIDSTVTEGGSATVTVTSDNVTTSGMTVNVDIAHTTTDNGDLTAPVTLAVNIPATSATGTSSVTILDDAVLEAAESFTATISGTTGGGEFENLVYDTTVHTVIVGDNDTASISSIAFTSAPGADGVYQTGDEIDVTVTFDHAVDVTGSPELNVTIENDTVADRVAAYHSGTGSAALLFKYTVQATDFDSDGFQLPANAIALNGGSILTNINSLAADLTSGATLADSGHKVYYAPTLSASASTIDEGDSFDVTATFAYSATFDRHVYLNDSAGTVITVLAGQTSASATLTSSHKAYQYQQKIGLKEVDGIVTDVVTNVSPVAVLQENITPSIINLLISSSPAGDVYIGSEIIELTASFDQTVAVSGSPYIELNIGGVLRQATYDSVSGNDVIFNYTVAESDTDYDGVSVDLNHIQLNGGSIVDDEDTKTRADLSFTALSDDENHRVLDDQLVIPFVTPLNDTGVVKGVTIGSQVNDDCSGTLVNEQDCSFGRDKEAVDLNLSKVGTGHAGFDYTKLASNGSPLAVQSGVYSSSGSEVAGNKWSCVKDNVTGLIWEVKTNSTQGTDLHSKYDTFDWYNTNSATNGGSDGSENTSATYCTDYNDGTYPNCNTQAFVERVNQAGLCGFSDWRLPNRQELHSLVSHHKNFPVINGQLFPNTENSFYWSSSPLANGSTQAWGIHFGNGDDYLYYHSNNYPARLVRGGQ